MQAVSVSAVNFIRLTVGAFLHQRKSAQRSAPSPGDVFRHTFKGGEFAAVVGVITRNFEHECYDLWANNTKGGVKGIDIQYIIDLLGHFSIKTAERHLHVKRQDLVSLINPLDELYKTNNDELPQKRNR